MHSHLHRLDRIWIKHPVYFITACTQNRQNILANPIAHNIILECWQAGSKIHGWQVGGYMIMPDHVHFLCWPNTDSAKPLERFVGGWKEYTAKKLAVNKTIPSGQLWQKNFFDRLLRNNESYLHTEKYMYENPIRAGLIAHPEDWPYKGDLSL